MHSFRNAPAMTQMFLSLLFAIAMGVLSLAAAVTEPAPKNAASLISAPEGY
jgi:hypothetical protein